MGIRSFSHQPTRTKLPALITNPLPQPRVFWWPPVLALLQMARSLDLLSPAITLPPLPVTVRLEFLPPAPTMISGHLVQDIHCLLVLFLLHSSHLGHMNILKRAGTGSRVTIEGMVAFFGSPWSGSASQSGAKVHHCCPLAFILVRFDSVPWGQALPPPGCFTTAQLLLFAQESLESGSSGREGSWVRVYEILGPSPQLSPWLAVASSHNT